ncbi:MAG: GDSL-type esterase/lipase family protein, partial [Lysobacterales bacterium]
MVLTGCAATHADLRYLALGDSYTIGEGVAPTERWPVQLAARLRADGIKVQEPIIIARTGWSVGELSAAMDAASLDAPYDLVTLLIGVNDQYRVGKVETYRAEFRTLLARAVALAGARAGRV